jgi:hypothetical protein
MDQNELMTERERFNALDPKEAKRILQEIEANPSFRTCWYCNGAHAHLKERKIFLCLACGFYYAQGYPIPVLMIRSEGRDVTEDEMRTFNKAIENA